MGILSWLFKGSKELRAEKRDTEPRKPPQAKRSRFDELLTDQAKRELNLRPLGDITLSGLFFDNYLNVDRNSLCSLMFAIEYQYVLRNRSAVSFALYRKDATSSLGLGLFEEYYYAYNNHRGLVGSDTDRLLDLFKTRLTTIGPSQWDMCTVSNRRHYTNVTGTPSSHDRQTTSFYYRVTLLVDPQNETVQKWGRILDAGKAKANDPAVKQLASRLGEADVAHRETVLLGIGGMWGEPVRGHTSYVEYPQVWQDFSFDEKLALAIAISELTDWLPAGVDNDRNPGNGTYEWVVCMKKRALLEKEANADRAQALKERQARQIALEKKPFLDL